MSVSLKWSELTPYQAPEARPAPVAPAPRQAISPSAMLAAAAASLLVALVAYGAWSVLAPRSTETLPMLAAPHVEGSVALAQASAGRKLGFVTVAGSVVNQTPHSIPRVEVVVELLDSAHRTLGVESALASADPLPARGESPFQVEVPDAPKAAGYRVHIRQLMGKSLE